MTPSGTVTTIRTDRVIGVKFRGNGLANIRRQAGQSFFVSIINASTRAIAVDAQVGSQPYCFAELTGPGLLAIPLVGDSFATHRTSDGSNFSTVASATIASTVTDSVDIAVGNDNVCYFLGEEVGATANTYVARYLATGARSAQRGTAGVANRVHAGSGVWVSGEVPTWRRGTGPYVARYSL